MHQRIFNDITEAFGGTPLVRLGNVTRSDATVLAKLEFYNPSGSVKDRLAIAVVDAAEASGDLRSGGTIVEATSGNTGIGLAMVGAARRYGVVLVMPDSVSRERRMLARAYGATVVMTPAGGGIHASMAEARRITAATPGAVYVDQFTNGANVAVHESTTGPEIWADTAGKVDVLVAGVGTGGTITGAGSYLRSQNASIRIIAVEPTESPVLSGGEPGSHRIQGIGTGTVPPVLDTDLYDEVITVDSDAAIAMARRLGTQEGILGGISSGASVEAAVRVAARPENAGRTIVVIVASFGERYLSTDLYENLGC